MYSTIVVPLDGSALSEQAIPVAAALARRDGATLHLVLVHEAPRLARVRDQEHWDEALASRDQAYVDEQAREVEKRYRVRVAPVLLGGAVVPAICQHVRATKADLVVITTHGRTGFSRAWLGSVADGLVRSLAVPVLMLRAGPGGPRAPRDGDGPFHRIMIPLDGSALAEQVLEHALRLGGVGPRYVLARVVVPVPQLDLVMPYTMPTPNVPDVEATERVEAEAARQLRGEVEAVRRAHPEIDVDAELYEATSPAEGLLEIAREQHAELIALTSHGRGASRLVLGSVADKLLRGSAAAMLVFRAEGD